MKETLNYFNSLNPHTTKIKYESGYPNVKPNVLVKFRPTLTDLDIVDATTGKILFYLKEENIISMNIINSENPKKSWLKLKVVGELSDMDISFVSDTSRAAQDFTDIKSNLLYFWKIVKEDENAEKNYYNIKDLQEKDDIKKANGCLIVGAIIIGLFVLFLLFGKKSGNSSTDNTTTNSASHSKSHIESLFSPWNGSLPALVEQTKESMKDPDSFEHIETTYRDDGNGLTVIMKYRGTNGFGAIVTETTSAKVDYNGEIIF